MYYMNKCLLPPHVANQHHPHHVWGTCDAVTCCGTLWSAVQLTHILLMLKPYLDSARQPEASSGQCCPEVDRQRGHLCRTVLSPRIKDVVLWTLETKLWFAMPV